MKAFQKLVSISAAFAMLMGGCRGNMPEEIPSENLHSVSTEDSDIVASGECGAEGDNLTWVLDSEGTLTISGTGDMENGTIMGQLWDHYDNSIKTVIIEDGVTSIGEEVFAYCESLTSITIPDSVTTIENNTFKDCSSLTSITIPDSVTSIESFAFYDCSSLTSITIPDSVTSIESFAFDDCSSLTAIDVDTNNEYYASEDGVLFNKNKTVLIQYPMKKDNQKYMIPDSVTSIGSNAFDHCSSLTSITIPDSVTTIEYNAFKDCSSLTSITIPDSVTSIESDAFNDCSSLTSITIPDSVTSIGLFAFYDCSSLTAIDVDTNNEYYASEDGVLFNKNKTVLIQYPMKKDNQKYMIPDSVTSIGDRAFEYCTSLTFITIPESVTSIGLGAFEYCFSLTSITIPDSVTSIGDRAFDECSSLTSITLNNPNCKIFDSKSTIHYSATIYGYEGSTAQAYAEKYDIEFISLG